MTTQELVGPTTATISDDADVEAWWAPDADVTGRLIAAVAVGCVAVPALNAQLDPATGAFRTCSSIDVGLLIDTGHHTAVVPVLCDVAHTSVTQIRRRLNSLRRLVAKDSCKPSIILVNFAHLACRYAALPVAPPQAAIVAAGHISSQALRKEGHLVLHHTLPLSLNFDSRACSVSDAARFLAAMKSDLAKPELPLSRG